MKANVIAVFGLLALAPVARASDTPAFVHATMCDVAAPISAGNPFFQRQIRFERPTGHVAGGAHSDRRHVTTAHRQAFASRPVSRQPVAEQVAPESDPVLRPAVHFCVTPGGQANPLRYT